MAASGAKSPAEAAAEEVRRVRMRKGWNQQQLADALHELGAPIDRATISKIETGERRITLDEVFLFAFALGVSPASLMLPRPFGSTVAVTPTVALETQEATDWLRGFSFPRHSSPGHASFTDEVFFFGEEIEEDALAWRRFPELMTLRDQAQSLVRIVMSGNAAETQRQLSAVEHAAKDARARIERGARSDTPVRRQDKSKSQKRKGRR